MVMLFLVTTNFVEVQFIFPSSSMIIGSSWIPFTTSARELHAWSMQAVRQKKLSEMEAEGIPAKYRAELARKKMTNW